MDLTCEHLQHDWTGDAGIHRVQWSDPFGRYDGHVPAIHKIEVLEVCSRCLATRWINECRGAKK